MAPLAIACGIDTDANNLTIYDSIETQGQNADCTIRIFKNHSLIQNGTMDQSGYSYKYVPYNLTYGVYYASIECNKTYNSTHSALFLSECTFEYEEDSNMMLAMIVGIVFVSGLFLFFAFQLQEDHFILKLLLIFFSLISLFFIAPVFLIGVEETAQMFIKITYAFFVLFLIYFIVYIFYHWFGQPKFLGILIGQNKK